MSTATDYHGNALSVGTRVWAYHDGRLFPATVAAIHPPSPGCEDHVHMTIRCDDGTEVERSSDAVMIWAINAVSGKTGTDEGE